MAMTSDRVWGESGGGEIQYLLNFQWPWSGGQCGVPCDGNHQKALEIPVLNSHKEEDTSTHLSSSNWERGPEKSEVTVE